MNIYDFSVKTRKGEDVSLSDYKGKVLLIVNTATGCGFTPQYDELQDLYEKIKVLKSSTFLVINLQIKPQEMTKKSTHFAQDALASHFHNLQKSM